MFLAEMNDMASGTYEFRLVREALKEREMLRAARTREDILWRRTKLGLSSGRIDVATLDRFMADEAPGAVPD